MGDRRIFPASVLLFSALFVALAPAAHAQVGLPNTDSVTSTVNDTVDTVGGTAGSTTDSVGDVVGEVGDTVGETVEDPGSLPGRVDDTVEDIAEEVPGGPGTDPLKQVVNQVGNTVDEVAGGNDPRGEIGSHGSVDGTVTDRKGTDRSPRRSDRVLGHRPERVPAAVSADGIFGALTTHTDALPPKVTFSSEPSFLGRVGDIALETAKKVAFPMALLALVAMFVAFHGRVGRKDPKLALAPVDPEQNFLSFE